ncbi:UAA transporter [Lipomyces arxii]|uniref:UAA transporter n=1 Tax=Lipomyces arxii TaxID=56418 RepID=UPI0034CE783B
MSTKTTTKIKVVNSKTSLTESKLSGRVVLQLLIAVAGIYASFLTWSFLQERITTTPYGPEQRVFRAPVVINTIQSFCATIMGYFYTLYSTRNSAQSKSVFPNTKTIMLYTLVSATSSLASPFGYASLKHIDYLTMLLGKSCKLLPVMALHVFIFRKKYALTKYVVVLIITLGVSFFTLYHPARSMKAKGPSDASLYGLLLLGINLLFDGLTNSVQDYIFQTQPNVSGPKLMCGINMMATILTSIFLLTPLTTQLPSALEFFKLYPQVLYDILLFSLCGAVGQLFIFFTMSKFGSLTLVTITVTRKMISMLLSVIWFNHRLTFGQWIGVFLVFAGVGGEALTKYIETKQKKRKMVEKVKKAK